MAVAVECTASPPVDDDDTTGAANGWTAMECMDPSLIGKPSCCIIHAVRGNNVPFCEGNSLECCIVCTGAASQTEYSEYSIYPRTVIDPTCWMFSIVAPSQMEARPWLTTAVVLKLRYPHSRCHWGELPFLCLGFYFLSFPFFFFFFFFPFSFFFCWSFF